MVPADLGHKIGRRLAVFRVVSVFLAATTTLAVLPLESATVGDGWRDAVNREAVRAVLFETSLGWAWAAQLAAASALALSAALPVRMRASAVAVASGLLMTMLALQGHAAMQEGWLGVIQKLNDAGHVLAGGAWLGALLPLLPVLNTLQHPDSRKEAGVALRRFSTMGHAAVAIVVVTGIVNTALVLGRWPTDWSSPYQAMLTVKIAIVALMVGLAILNRYVVVPRITRRLGSALQVLRGATLFEIALGATAIALVSVFGLLEPV